MRGAAVGTESSWKEGSASMGKKNTWIGLDTLRILLAGNGVNRSRDDSGDLHSGQARESPLRNLRMGFCRTSNVGPVDSCPSLKSSVFGYQNRALMLDFHSQALMRS